MMMMMMIALASKAGIKAATCLPSWVWLWMKRSLVTG